MLSSASKVDSGHTDQSQQKSNHGGQSSGSMVELDDGLEKLFPVLVQGLDGHDRA